MKNMQNEVILKLTKKLQIFFGPMATCSLQSEQKLDQSAVTEIDLFVSQLVKEQLQTIEPYSHYTFFSEEDYSRYHFPCAILDPIDGTRELIEGRPECAVSLALMHSSEIAEPRNYAWIYNPFSGFSIDTATPFVSSLNRSGQKSLALVSRLEFHKGLYEDYLMNSQIDISPRGSIAFKLGLLASGACDFVISLTPKNTWDIAAGTVLCNQRGIYFYQNGIRLEKLDKEKYEGILIWSSEEQFPFLKKFLEKEFLKMK